MCQFQHRLIGLQKTLKDMTGKSTPLNNGQW